MPLTVECTCGKSFKVVDELAGSRVKCHVCGASVPVTPEQFQLPPEADDGSPTFACPACSEQIPKGSRVCPLCREIFANSPLKIAPTRLPDTERELLTARVRESLQNASPTLDDRLKGGLLSTKTTVLLGIVGLCLLSFVAGMSMKGGEGLIALGVGFGIIFIIPAIVSLTNDHNASHIQDASSAKEAFSRFMMSVRTGRANKAFFALAPLSRTVTAAESIKFTNPKIVNNPRTFAFNDPKSFLTYWKYNFTAPSMQSRNMTIKNVRSVGKTPEGFEVVEATIETYSHNSLLYLLILAGLLVAVIVIYSVQQKEEVIIRKTMAQHNGRWYVLDGSMDGELDHML